MTTYAELVDSVVAITNRPSLVNEMRVAIRKSIFKFHQADTFKRDLNIVTINMSLYPDLNFRWDIDVSNGDTFPRYRKYSFLRVPPSSYPTQAESRPLDYPWGFPKSPVFTPVSADNIFDDYQVERVNYYYQAGMNLVLHTTFQPQFLELGYYQYPGFVYQDGNVTLTSWIADQYQDAIAEEAAGTIFKMIGKDEEASIYRSLFAENILMVRGTDIGNEE